MNKLLIILACASSVLAQVRIPGPGGTIPSGGGGTVTLINTTNCASKTSGASCTIPATGAGNHLVFAIGVNNSGASVTGITGGSNTSAQFSGSACALTASSGCELWVTTSITTGTTSVAVNLSAGSAVYVVYEIHGSTATDQVGILNNQVSTTSPVSPSLTIATASEFFAGVLVPAVGCTNVSAGWTLDSTTSGYCIASRITSSTGTYQATYTTTLGVASSNLGSLK